MRFVSKKFDELTTKELYEIIKSRVENIAYSSILLDFSSTLQVVFNNATCTIV